MEDWEHRNANITSDLAYDPSLHKWPQSQTIDSPAGANLVDRAGLTTPTGVILFSRKHNWATRGNNTARERYVQANNCPPGLSYLSFPVSLAFFFFSFFSSVGTWTGTWTGKYGRTAGRERWYGVLWLELQRTITEKERERSCHKSVLTEYMYGVQRVHSLHTTCRL